MSVYELKLNHFFFSSFSWMVLQMTSRISAKIDEVLKIVWFVFAFIFYHSHTVYGVGKCVFFFIIATELTTRNVYVLFMYATGQKEDKHRYRESFVVLFLVWNIPNSQF